jgi:serine/threonine protein kinase
MSDTGLPKGVILNNTYLIKRQIAVSNLTIVYLGFDKKKRRVCVIKEFYPQKMVLRDLDQRTVICKYASQTDVYYQKRDLFQQEAAILKSIRCRNVVEYLDDFIENNTGYIVTKYYKGNTLDQYMAKEKNVAIAEFYKNIFIPLLDAIDALHKQGIIHRDIKPSNIIIDSKLQPVLIDFGSAIRFREKPSKDIFVTPGFSPLELYSKDSEQGRYSDIYSLAATLYYYLCGKVPVTATERIIEDQLEDIRKNNRIISRFLAWVIMKNLSADYKKRFHSLSIFKNCVYLEYLRVKVKRVGY